MPLLSSARSRRSRWALGVAGLALVIGLRPAVAETLRDALAEAYDTNPRILAERANLRAIDEDVPQALSGYRPTINVTGSEGRQHIDNHPANKVFGPPSINDWPGTIDAQLRQPLYNGGGTVAKVAKAEDTVTGERARNLATEESVFFSVIEYYYDVLQNTAIVDIDRQYEKSLRQLLQATRGSYRIGALTRVDVQQTEAKLEGVTAQREVDKGKLETSRANFERFVGHPPEALSEPTLRPVIPKSLDDAVRIAASNNLSVIAAQYGERSAHDAVAASEAQLLPKLSLVMQKQFQTGTSIPGVDTNSQSVLVQLTVPFYDAGLAWSQSRQAIQRVGQAEDETDGARRRAVEGAKQDWQVLQAARRAIGALAAAVKADKLAVQGVRAQQRAGARTIFDVLLQEQQLYTDETTQAKTLHDLYLSEFNLALQVGRLTAADLHLKVKLYNVRKHYDSVRDKLIGLDSDSN